MILIFFSPSIQYIGDVSATFFPLHFSVIFQLLQLFKNDFLSHKTINFSISSSWTTLSLFRNYSIMYKFVGIRNKILVISHGRSHYKCIYKCHFFFILLQSCTNLVNCSCIFTRLMRRLLRVYLRQSLSHSVRILCINHNKLCFTVIQLFS